MAVTVVKNAVTVDKSSTTIDKVHFNGRYPILTGDKLPQPAIA
jgi:hypothetical protein